MSRDAAVSLSATLQVTRVLVPRRAPFFGETIVSRGAVLERTSLPNVCRPEESEGEHQRLLAQEEEIIRELGIPYRVMNIAAGDLGPAAAKKYDVEGWFPVQARYRELTSTSNTTDFQARRLNIRFRRDKALEHVHTLNGTAVTARAMLSIMENFQDEDGSVAVPEPLVELGAPPRLGAESTRSQA